MSARESLSQRRRGETIDFAACGLVYTATLGRYPDGRLGEVFLRSGKSGTHASISSIEIAEHQRALAVYTNQRGQAVIRQEAGWCDEQDSIILVNRENIIATVYALLDQTDGAFEITERVEGGWCDMPRQERPQPGPKREAQPERLALPAPDHRSETVTPDLFAGGAHAKP